MIRACSAADTEPSGDAFAEKALDLGDSDEATENFGVLSANAGTSERCAGGEISAKGRGASAEGMCFTSARGGTGVSAVAAAFSCGAGTLLAGKYLPFHEARKKRLTRPRACAERRALCEFN